MATLPTTPNPQIKRPINGFLVLFLLLGGLMTTVGIAVYLSITSFTWPQALTDAYEIFVQDYQAAQEAKEFTSRPPALIVTPTATRSPNPTITPRTYTPTTQPQQKIYVRYTPTPYPTYDSSQMQKTYDAWVAENAAKSAQSEADLEAFQAQSKANMDAARAKGQAGMANFEATMKAQQEQYLKDNNITQ